MLEADALYKENIEGALAAGLDVGVYVYSQAITTAEARAEANYTMKLIKGYNIKLPVVMDYEYYINHSGRLARANLSPAAATTICTAFCEEVEKNNYTAMVYANKSLLTDDVYADVLANGSRSGSPNIRDGILQPTVCMHLTKVNIPTGSTHLPAL